MKIFVNAATVKLSGGLAVSLSIIHAFKNFREVELYIASPKLPEYNEYAPANAKIWFVKSWMLLKIFRWLLDHYFLPGKIKEFDPDVVFSLSNLPAISKYKQIFYHDNPFFTAESLQDLNLSFTQKISHDLRNHVTRKRLRKLNNIIVQSSSEAGKIQEKFPDASITIIPPSLPVYWHKIPKTSYTFPDISGNNKNILCFSHYYPHKNIEILFEVARIFEKKNAPYKFIVSCIAHNYHLKKKLKKYNSEYISSLDVANLEEAYNILPLVDAFILPSLLESFSLNYIEAWFFEKPLFTSNLDFGVQNCEEAAIYFDPLNPEDIYETIDHAFKEGLTEKCKLKGKQRLEKLPDWNEVIQYILENNSV